MPESLLDHTCVKPRIWNARFTGVGWEGIGDGEIEKQMDSLLPVIQL